MDFWELLAVMVRRWYVTLPILALTAVLAVTMPARVDPTYRASGTVVLVEPAGNAADLNPVASAGLNANANALATIATLPDAQSDVAEAGLSTQYTVESDGSVLVIEAGGATPNEAAETVQFVEQLLTERLNQQQENVGAPVESYLTVVPLIAEPVAVPVYDDQRRVRILVVVAGVLLAAMAAVGVEGLAVRRRTRRRAPSKQPDPTKPSAEPADGAPAADPATEGRRPVHLDGGTGSAELTVDRAPRTEPLVR
jgi:hypothetical protein